MGTDSRLHLHHRTSKTACFKLLQSTNLNHLPRLKELSLQ
ncbi:hypothetical protein LINPERPRIM_LOCUS8327 [Linum perenne]